MLIPSCNRFLAISICLLFSPIALPFSNPIFIPSSFACLNPFSSSLIAFSFSSAILLNFFLILLSLRKQLKENLTAAYLLWKYLEHQVIGYTGDNYYKIFLPNFTFKIFYLIFQLFIDFSIFYWYNLTMKKIFKLFP